MDATRTLHTSTAGLAFDVQKGALLLIDTEVELDKNKNSSEHLRASSTELDGRMGPRRVLNKIVFYPP